MTLSLVNFDQNGAPEAGQGPGCFTTSPSAFGTTRAPLHWRALLGGFAKSQRILLPHLQFTATSDDLSLLRVTSCQTVLQRMHWSKTEAIAKESTNWCVKFRWLLPNLISNSINKRNMRESYDHRPFGKHRSRLGSLSLRSKQKVMQSALALNDPSLLHAVGYLAPPPNPFADSYDSSTAAIAVKKRTIQSKGR